MEGDAEAVEGPPAGTTGGDAELDAAAHRLSVALNASAVQGIPIPLTCCLFGVADGAFGSPSKRKRSRQLFNDLSQPNEHDDNDLVATLLALASPQPTAPRPRARRRPPLPDSPTSTASDPSSPTQTPSQSRRKRKPVPERLLSAGRGPAVGAASAAYHAHPTRGGGPSRKRQRQDDDDDSESLPPSASKRVRASPGGKKGKGRTKKGSHNVRAPVLACPALPAVPRTPPILSHHTQPAALHQGGGHEPNLFMFLGLQLLLQWRQSPCRIPEFTRIPEIQNSPNLRSAPG
jgi:hypothetical protein